MTKATISETHFHVFHELLYHQELTAMKNAKENILIERNSVKAHDYFLSRNLVLGNPCPSNPPKLERDIQRKLRNIYPCYFLDNTLSFPTEVLQVNKQYQLSLMFALCYKESTCFHLGQLAEG